MPLGPKGNPYITDEQLEEARQCSALEYARSRNYDLVSHGSGNYHLREHDSMVFTADGRWFWNSRRVSGRALEFIMHYEMRPMIEAVMILTNDPALGGERQEPVNYMPKPAAPVQPKEFKLPDRAENSRQLYGYLCGGRGLDRDIVHELIHNGRIYQSVRTLEGGATVHNAVFVGYDDQHRPRSAFQRGMSAQSSFKREASGSNKSWPFMIPGSPGTRQLVLFEGAIDAISFASVIKAQGENWRDYTMMAMSGSFSMEPINRYLDTHPDIEVVYTAFDNDAAGKMFAQHVVAELGQRVIVGSMDPPSGKDWNQYLTEVVRPQERPSVKDVLTEAQQRSAHQESQRADRPPPAESFEH